MFSSQLLESLHLQPVASDPVSFLNLVESLGEKTLPPIEWIYLYHSLCSSWIPSLLSFIPFKLLNQIQIVEMFQLCWTRYILLQLRFIILSIWPSPVILYTSIRATVKSFEGRLFQTLKSSPPWANQVSDDLLPMLRSPVEYNIDTSIEPPAVQYHPQHHHFLSI
jgi:hypothetical protein